MINVIPSSVQQQKLMMHSESHEKKSIEFNVCAEICTTKWRLNTHIKNREEHVYKDWGAIFCNLHNFKHHVSDVHNLRKRDICNMVFCLKNNKWHMYSKHQQSVQVYSCQIVIKLYFQDMFYLRYLFHFFW